MLILTRKPEESLVIDGNITVTILDVSGKCVRIGIEAPKDIAVHREEVAERIAAEQERSRAG